MNRVQKTVLQGIAWYQAHLSPDHSPRKELYPYGYCRFYPSCSQYGYQAVEKYGVIKGGFMTAWRIMRCNPFTQGGNDPVI